MITVITEKDLKLINDLSNRKYINNSMTSSSSEKERLQFKDIKKKLHQIAQNYQKEYNSAYGNLDCGISSGNPIAIGGIRLNRLWSGLFKGAENKQYSGQISFVMNPYEPFLDLGFYFGRASAHKLSKSEKNRLEARLKYLGKSLYKGIVDNIDIKNRFESLFDYGFKAYIKGQEVIGDEWLKTIKKDPVGAQIVYKLAPNEEGYIEPSTISFYTSMLIFMMGYIPSFIDNHITNNPKALTAAQRAKQAERKALIGLQGELFALKKEEEKLKSYNIDYTRFLKHVALESDKFGYDIVSCDENMNKIFIEVKTTTRIREDKYSKKFHMSTNELNFYKKNKNRHRLYRVYDIEGSSPEIEIVDMENVKATTNSYIIEIMPFI